MDIHFYITVTLLNAPENYLKNKHAPNYDTYYLGASFVDSYHKNTSYISRLKKREKKFSIKNEKKSNKI